MWVNETKRMRKKVAKEKENLINLPDFLCLSSDASWLTKNRERETDCEDQSPERLITIKPIFLDLILQY